MVNRWQKYCDKVSVIAISLLINVRDNKMHAFTEQTDNYNSRRYRPLFLIDNST